ncbi:MAG: hypothetical protein QF685_02220 [Verrucomicrobiota bacterium]|nr:hypothetical protein [Verrucomicrobiota bacterium]
MRQSIESGELQEFNVKNTGKANIKHRVRTEYRAPSSNLNILPERDPLARMSHSP